MSRASFRAASVALLGSVLLLPALGAAQSWQEFRAAFPLFPCPDGWSGCVVGEARVGQQGDQLPADLRLDWFELTPTPAFSPFSGLSDYTKAPPSRLVVPTPAPPPPVAPPPPKPPPRRVARKQQPRIERPTPVPPKPPPVEVEQVDTPPGVTSAECAEIIPLETPAMLGQLTPDQMSCLEGRVARDPKQTGKRHASLVLITNAWGAGDRSEWERLVLRHLEGIDRSDPALCYKLALHLEEQGPPRAAEVIRWSEIAMRNARRSWNGNEFTDKMYSLHRLRSKAAQELWYVADGSHVSNPTDESRAAAERYRGTAKNYSKEWYQYAKNAGKDTTHPFEMCKSAAGSSEFCED